MSYVDTLVDDMALFHDGPAYTLKYIPVWGSGRNSPESYSKPAGWTDSRAWGVITADYPVSFSAPWRVPGPYSGNQAPNTRVQIRDLQIWYLSLSGVWELKGQATIVSGAAYHAQWAGDINKPADTRNEPANNGGGISIRYINYADAGFGEFLYHFWGAGGTPPNSYLGVATCYYARKILHDPGGADDRAQARLMADVAGDWWIYPGALYNNPPNGNQAMGYNRFKYLTNDWQLISWYSNNTLSAAQIRANPPPFIGLELVADSPQPPTPPEPPVEPPQPPFTPLVVPTRGAWFPKLTNGKNTWGAHAAAGASADMYIVDKPEDEDDMPQIKQGETTDARKALYIEAYDAGTGDAYTGALSGADIKISKGGGAMANSAGVATHLNAGLFRYVPTAGELDTVGGGAIQIAKSGLANTKREFTVVPWDPFNAASLGLTNVDTSISSRSTLTADALLDLADGIETGLTPRQALRLIASVIAGLTTGAGTNTEVFRASKSNSKPRATYTITGANRTAVTLDLD